MCGDRDLRKLDDALQKSSVCEDACLHDLVAVFEEHESFLVFAHTEGYLSTIIFTSGDWKEYP